MGHTTVGHCPNRTVPTKLNWSCINRSRGIQRIGTSPSRCAINSSCRGLLLSAMLTRSIARQGTSAIKTRRNAFATLMSVSERMNLTLSDWSLVTWIFGVLDATVAIRGTRGVQFSSRFKAGADETYPQEVRVLSPSMSKTELT